MEMQQNDVCGQPDTDQMYRKQPHTSFKILHSFCCTQLSAFTSTYSAFALCKTQNERRGSRSPQTSCSRQDMGYCVRVYETCRCSDGTLVMSLKEIDRLSLAYWLVRFTRKHDGSEYPLNTLHHIVCGIMRHMRNTTMPGVHFFKDTDFNDFRSSLDAEMKRLQAKGLGSNHK